MLFGDGRPCPRRGEQGGEFGEAWPLHCGFACGRTAERVTFHASQEGIVSPLKSASKWLGGCLALLLMAAGPALAQTGTITGTVTDATTGQPLVGAQVVVVGTNLSVPTNQSGRFLIPGVAAGERQVRASMIGYGAKTFTVTVTAGATAVQDFALEMSAIELEGLVVNAATGREQRRREVGNSVGTVNVDNVQLAPITNTAQLLQGKVAGATILQSSGLTGSGTAV